MIIIEEQAGMKKSIRLMVFRLYIFTYFLTFPSILIGAEECKIFNLILGSAPIPVYMEAGLESMCIRISATASPFGGYYYISYIPASSGFKLIPGLGSTEDSWIGPTLGLEYENTERDTFFSYKWTIVHGLLPVYSVKDNISDYKGEIEGKPTQTYFAVTLSLILGM